MQDTHDAQNGGPKARAAHEPPKECDLVMKGGITSGIVYPPLVIKLHEHGYSFRNVGGTSAGAIAAAFAAAAELGKERGGFEKLHARCKWLSEDEHLLRLFQPSGATRPLMEAALDLVTFHNRRRRARASNDPARREEESYRSKILSVVLGLSGRLHATADDFYRKGASAGLRVAATLAFALALLAALVFTASAAAVVGWTPALKTGAAGFVATFALLAAVLGFAGERAGGLAFGLYRLATDGLRANFYGLCDGRPATDSRDAALTDWMHETLNELAGRDKDDPPLAFFDLWGTRTPRRDGKRIDLRMMTSDLSQNQPYMLPFDGGTFIFKRDDLERLFPPNVVAHMIRRRRPCKGVVLPKGYYFLPEAKELPVVFATRMSLSFPVLISMIPLYTVSQKAFKNGICCRVEEVEAEGPDGAKETKEVVVFSGRGDGMGWHTCIGDERVTLAEDDLQPNWFSDGGICSNFPIHFFDSWLPTRPTFGVNLTSQLSETGGPDGVAETIKMHSSVTAHQGDFPEDPLAEPPDCYNTSVYLPRPDEDIPPEWVPIDGLGQLLGNAFRTAQNYRDNMQAMLPSYRERIVQIRLNDEEGGLNLNMDEDVINAVIVKGQRAGVLLTDFDMPSHQWVRFRVLMKQMELSLSEMYEALNNCGFYMSTIGHPPLPEGFPYKATDAQWCLDARRQLDEMGRVFRALNPPRLFSSERNSPMPEPVLRVMPNI